jgi:hypothetical protein
MINAPGTMALYGVYYWLFKKFFWKWKWLRTVGLIETPILEGTWEGELQTNHPGHEPATHKVAA